MPHEVVSMLIDREWSVIRAWRTYLRISQPELAQRLGISQSAYSQQELCTSLCETSRQKIAAALGVNPEQLDV